jgi:uncharacterized membrane protein YgaE (UPF0421/DUF939 family)
MTIGARVLKTGLSVALAIYVSNLLGFTSPIITAIAAIAVQPSISRSWQHITDQLQTNVLGAAVALMAIHFFGQTALSVGVVCIIVILVSIRLRMESTVSLTLVTVVAVMETQGQGWEFAWGRLLMIFVGMMSSVTVNLLVFPPRPRQQFMDQVHEAFGQLSLLLRMAISNELKEDVHREEKTKLNGTLRKLEDRYTLFEQERPFTLRRRQANARQLIMSRQLIKTLQRGADLLDVIEEHYFTAPEALKWAKQLDNQIEELTKYHEQLLLKLEGKLKPRQLFEPEDARETNFIVQMNDYLQKEDDERMRLVFVGSAIFEYAYHLRRLDKIVDQLLQHIGEGATKG